VINNKAQIFTQMLTCIHASSNDEYAARTCLQNMGRFLLKIAQKGQLIIWHWVKKISWWTTTRLICQLKFSNAHMHTGLP